MKEFKITLRCHDAMRFCDVGDVLSDFIRDDLANDKHDLHDGAWLVLDGRGKKMGTYQVGVEEAIEEAIERETHNDWL